jgi:lysozyme
VCYGDTHNVDRNKVYTLAECKQRLNDEMLRTVETVDRCQPGLPDNVLAAFSDAAYNIGPTVACATAHSTAARLLKSHEYRRACQELPKWVRARVAGVLVALPGLTKRRLLERDLCLKGLT